MSKPSAPAIKPLRVNDLLFVNAYLSLDRNGTRAYQAVHPKASYNVAAQRAHVVLKKVEVQAEIARRLQVEQGWTKQVAVSRVLDVAARAQAKSQLDTELRAYAEVNALAGLHVQQVKDLTDKPPVDRTALIEQLRQRGLVAVPTN